MPEPVPDPPRPREVSVVYSAVFGGVDEIAPPPPLPRGWQAILFTDSEHDVPGWDVRRMPPPLGPPRPSSRLFKLLPHVVLPEATRSLWIDGRVIFTSALIDEVESSLASSELTFFTHVAGFAEEAARICSRGYVSPRTILRQTRRYRRLGLPAEASMFAGTVIGRRHTPEIAQFNTLWFEETSRGGGRDQLSLSFSLWRCGLEPRPLPGRLRTSDLLRLVPHLERGYRRRSRLRRKVAGRAYHRFFSLVLR
jgi:hypothetical protein